MNISLPIKKIVYELNSNRALPLQGRFPTITLRGAFGYSMVQLLARADCIADNKKVKICKRLFFSNGISDKSSHLNCARPFVMRGWYSRPDKKAFLMEMLLFGEACTMEIFIDNVIKNMCEMGLGDQGIRCNCIKLESSEIIPKVPDLSTGMCSVNFISPVRIKTKGKFLKSSVPFYNLFCRLADRLKELINIYTDKEFFFNELSTLKQISQFIDSEVEYYEFFKVKRVSSRTNRQSSLNGFVGKISYYGDLNPFAEILAFLPWIHVGSNTAFGCGWCTLEYLNLSPQE